MKYIIMCGGEYKQWETPRQLTVLLGETLVERTIRLLRENGIKDINISSNNPVFEKFGVPVLKHDNFYVADGFRSVQGDWFNAFYPTNEPTCYIFGDVFFSDEAIKTIVNTKTTDIDFFGSKPPFNEKYIKTHEEPFALKVVNTDHLKKAIKKTRELDKQNKFWRKPIMWELWTVIKNAPLQTKPGHFTADYIAINDYTCDIDWKDDGAKILRKLGVLKMLRVKVIERFTLGEFDLLQDIERANPNDNEEGRLYVGDKFICDEEMYKYLTKTNSKGRQFVELIEYMPKEKNEN